MYFAFLGGGSPASGVRGSGPPYLSLSFGEGLGEVYLYPMPDVHTAATRSYNMSRIKGKDTKPELLVRKFLHAKGYRYKLHDKKLPGKPDIVLPKYKTVIFVNGCFWHGHKNCKYFVIPKTRTDWWLSKINGNIANDKRNTATLRKAGWNIITIWECQLKGTSRDRSLHKLTAIL